MMLALPRFHYGVAVAGASHVGNVRTNNEDAWRVDMDLGVLAVADGMGGHAAGEVASALGIDTLIASLRVPEAAPCFDSYLTSPTLEARRQVFSLLRWAAQQAHQRVVQEAERDKSRRGMGCTLEAALLLGEAAFVVHVGDSRTYVARPRAVVQLTHDQTVEGSRLASGLRTPSEPPAKRDALTSAVGHREGPRIDEIFVELAEGDRLMMCTDGVHGQIAAEADIAQLVRLRTPPDAVHALITAALEAGGNDNATVIVIDVASRRARAAYDGGQRARDLTLASNCFLLTALAHDAQARVLSVCVETEFAAGARIPRFFTEDRVAYIVLEGEASTPEGWTLGPSAVLYPESLAGAGRGTVFASALRPLRALRIRYDDFREVCHGDVVLSASLYERLARALAQRF